MEVKNKALERLRLETRIRTLEVQSVSDITPRMRRIRLTGADLAGFQSPGHADHVKVFISSDGRPLGRPLLGPTGVEFDDEVAKPFMRDYTPRYFDPAALTLDLDFVLHGDGPASGWAARARPGDSLVIGGPRGTVRIPDAFDWHFLAGDETALPAIGRRLEELPLGARAIAVIEIADAAEEQQFASRADVTIHWVHRNGLSPGAINLLLEATTALKLPAGDGFAFVAAEALNTKAIRAHLVEQRGFPIESVRAAGYWVRDEASH